MIKEFTEPGRENEILLDGPIDYEMWWGDECTPEDLTKVLSGKTGDIVLWINSPGGVVEAASMMIMAVKEYPGRVIAKIPALAASAATLLSTACDEVWMLPLGFYMIHQSSTIAWGQSKELHSAANSLDELDEAMAKAYQSKTGLPIEEIRQMMMEETWMNGYTAKEKGFVDKLLYVDDMEGEQEEAASDPGKKAVAQLHRLPMTACLGAGPSRFGRLRSREKEMTAEEITGQLEGKIIINARVSTAKGSTEEFTLPLYQQPEAQVEPEETTKDANQEDDVGARALRQRLVSQYFKNTQTGRKEGKTHE